MSLGHMLNVIFLMIGDIAVIALTTDVVFFFFIKQVQQRSQLWTQFLHLKMPCSCLPQKEAFIFLIPV